MTNRAIRLEDEAKAESPPKEEVTKTESDSESDCYSCSCCDSCCEFSESETDSAPEKPKPVVVSINGKPKVIGKLEEVKKKRGRPPKNSFNFGGLKDITQMVLGVKKWDDTKTENVINAIKKKPGRPKKSISLIKDDLKKYNKKLMEKINKLTPRQAKVKLVNVLDSFTKDIQNYLKAGFPLLNVSSMSVLDTGKEKSFHEDEVDRELIQLEDNVWAKHRNGRFYKARVTDVRAAILLYVYFPADQSFSKDVKLSDLVGWNKSELPSVGEKIQIRWTDGEIYEADFLGKIESKIYTVLFEDESRLELRRDAIYSLTESIPKKIASKLSYASEMNHREHLYELTSPLPQKRPVKKKKFEDE